MENNNHKYHVEKMAQALEEIADHLRKDIKIVNEPQCKAMFETAAEVLLGLKKAFADYLEKSEDAWK